MPDLQIRVVDGVLQHAPTAPAAAQHTRRFKAAKSGRLAGGFGNLFATSARMELREDIRGLVGHSRVAAQNFDHVKSYERLIRRHVIGASGIALQMACKNANGTLDTGANKAIEDAWRRWGKRGVCTVCGGLSWWQVEKVAATMLAREGNFFLRVWMGSQFGPFGFQVQLISIDLLDLDYRGHLSDGGYIEGGMEFDAWGKIVAFHFFDGHPAEHFTAGTRNRIRIPAAQIIHVIRPEETGQDLGKPELHTALRRFNMLNKYEESAQTAAWYGAAAMVFFEQQMGEDGPAPAAALEDSSLDDVPEEMTAGSMIDLPPGVTVKGNPSNYPDQAMGPFNTSLLKGGAAGAGVSYGSLAADSTGSTFTSLRHDNGEQQDEIRMFQRDLFEGLHERVFQAWITPAILTGQVILENGTRLPASRAAKFRAATWRPRGWESVNRKEDATANDKDLANLLIAPRDIVARRGEDFEQLVDRIAGDLEFMRLKGLPLPAALAGKNPSEPITAEDVETAVQDSLQES